MSNLDLFVCINSQCHERVEKLVLCTSVNINALYPSKSGKMNSKRGIELRVLENQFPAKRLDEGTPSGNVERWNGLTASLAIWNFERGECCCLKSDEGYEVALDSVRSFSESIYHLPKRNCLHYQNMVSSILNGTIWFDNVCIEFNGKVGELIIVVVLRDSKTMRIFEEEGDVLKICEGEPTNGILYINAAGRRWEGGILDQGPFGYGRLYDERNRLVYEGFMHWDTRVAYGRVYNQEQESVYYDGGFCDNQFFGYGKEYDERSNCIYSGEWIFGEHIDEFPSLSPYVIGFDMSAISMDACPRGCSEFTHFCPSPLLFNLKIIELACDSLPFVLNFTISNLPNLEVIAVGEKSKETYFSVYHGDGKASINNCPLLREIRIMNGVFDDFTEFSLSDLDNLKVIEIGGKCFQNVETFVLKGQ